MQFTYEAEEQKKIIFLDLTLIRKDESIKTSWYQKPTWSGRYLNYNSHHPKNQKLSVIIGLIDRAVQLTSPEYRPEALKKARDVLKSNHFPQKLINRIFKQRIHKFYNNHTKTLNTITNTTYIAFPYTNELSEKIKYTLSKYNINVCHKSQSLLNSLYTPLKSKIPIKKISNIIYSIQCLNCLKTYIGLTTQLLENRINGHKYTKNATTALHKHEHTEKYEFDFKNAKVRNQDSNYKKLIVKEMIHIKKDSNTVNDKKDIKNVSQIYCNLLN